MPLLPTTEQRRATLRAIDRAERAMLPAGITEDLCNAERINTRQAPETTMNPHRQNADMATINLRRERILNRALAAALGIAFGVFLAVWLSNN